ncbi:DUF3866 family protein [Phosphitispora sp. TUW77]|uniref:DUF3866 family protein n=1 Tax=Phosphitispora sp. TUW77 TaxID=3152361 RepID=UPI003AB774AE
MIRIRQGKVTEILERRRGVTEIKVEIQGANEGEIAKAINYDFLTGPVQLDDEVSLNTTAVHKRLGSGGYHYVMANLNIKERDVDEIGHIMKLRYTPMQVKCFSVEEELNPSRAKIEDFTSMKKTPVIVGALHSMLAPAAAGVKAASRGKLRVAYIMTDGGALPLQMSRMVAELKDKGLIDATITVGHAFGGDFEAVNIYTGLIAAKQAVKADVIIVTMGPGIVGTGTKYGFTGIEQGEIINAVNILEGKPIAIPRISFVDPRDRHLGISHHTITVLTKIAITPCVIPMPTMDPIKEQFVNKQIIKSGIPFDHEVIVEDGAPALRYLIEKDIVVTTMGRTMSQDREYFLAAGAAGILATRYVVY